MAQAYQFTFIDAPIDTVWHVVFQNADQHGITITMQEPQLLIIRVQDVCSIYGLRTYPAMENKTGVYLVMTHDEVAASDVINAPDLFRALEALPGDVAPEIYEAGKSHLQQIKELANEAAHKEAVNALASKSSFDVKKSSIDPNKSGPELPDAPPYGQGVPVIKLGLVWLAFIFTGGLFSAGLLLALNWWSLGKTRKALSTLVASAVVMSVLDLLIVIVYMRINSPDTSLLTVTILLQFLVSVGVVLWQVMLQKPTYKQSVEQYGKPSGWKPSGILLSIVAIVAGVAIGNSWPGVFNSVVFGASAALTSISPQKAYADERITVSYPAHWGTTDWFEDFCTDDHVECLVTVGEPVGGGALMVLEVENYFGLFVTLDATSTYFKNELGTGIDNFHDATELRFEIDGREAVRHQFYYTTDIGTGRQAINQPMVATLVLIRNGSDYIRIDSYAPVPLAGTIEAIIDSLHFVKPLEND